jgi:hypothetical protein
MVAPRFGWGDLVEAVRAAVSVTAFGLGQPCSAHIGKRISFPVEINRFLSTY